MALIFTLEGRRDRSAAQLSSARRHQRGVTLVEIGAVLVVIGLLLAAVLKGKELIATAQLNGLIQKMSGYKAAIRGFEDRYRFVPGDSMKASALLGAGALNCHSGGIYGACHDGLLMGTGEVMIVNNNLSVAGFYSGPAKVNGNSPLGWPPSAETHMTNHAGGPIVYGTSRYVADLAGPFLQVSGPTTGITTGGNLTTRLLGELDRKIDDGHGMTGRIRSAWFLPNSQIWQGCLSRNSGTFGAWYAEPIGGCGAIDLMG